MENELLLIVFALKYTIDWLIEWLIVNINLIKYNYKDRLQSGFCCPRYAGWSHVMIGGFGWNPRNFDEP